MKCLLLLVGIYRAPYAWIRSKNLLDKHTECEWDTIMVTDKAPYCKQALNQVILVNASSFLNRLKRAYDMIDWSPYTLSVITRPDVALTRSVNVKRLCEIKNTTYVISGDFTRHYIFHNRDWDFGYVACNFHLFKYVTLNNLTHTRLPSLPRDFHGCWGNCVPSDWRYPYMENVLHRHLENGATLRNLDSYHTFLSLKRGFHCSSPIGQ
jgi:hypothetical protein